MTWRKQALSPAPVGAQRTTFARRAGSVNVRFATSSASASSESISAREASCTV
jgi:hypothetical protein